MVRKGEEGSLPDQLNVLPVSSVRRQLLRRARLERGWTQQVVAERIGAPHDLMVSRWERGTAFPSAYYTDYCVK